MGAESEINITNRHPVSVDVLTPKSMLAIISDIHGNLEALDAVLAQIKDMEVLCLGDIVLYGPDSIECVRRSHNWKSVVASPLDLAMLNHDPNQWNSEINRRIERTRQRFENASDANSLFQILTSYRSEHSSGGIWFFHGRPRDIRDWIFPEDIYCTQKLDRAVDSTEFAFIGGGSHIPGIFRRSTEGWEFSVPRNNEPYHLEQNGKTIITVGSVGQPRDGDPRAAFITLDGATIVFHRVEYDMDVTITKIKDDPDNDNSHGDRLPHGR